MTDERMTLQSLLEKTPDADFLRQMIGFAAQRLMELDIESRAGEAPPLLHPEMASYYRRQIEQLHLALHDEDETHRIAATEAIRSLIEAIILTPGRRRPTEHRAARRSGGDS